jgi:hypothetical protein
MIVRAATHIHSNWSHDGKWTLSKLAAFFGKAGYRLLLTAEHDESLDSSRWQSYRQACIEASSDQILIIPGIEYSDISNTIHILVWGDLPFLGTMSETTHLLKKISELKGIAVLAHPSRRDAWQKFHPSWSPFLVGIELWNRKVDGVAPSVEAVKLLGQSTVLVPFMGLDFHRANQFFPLAMKLDVEGGISETGVLSALREKRVSAEAFGVSFQYYTTGFCGKVVSSAERLRRLAKRALGKNGS